MSRVIFMFLAIGFAADLLAQPVQDTSELTAAEKGLAIAVEADKRDSGFGDSTTDIEMVLISADGRQRVRRLTWMTLEGAGDSDGEKTLTIFHEPRDIEGTAFLSHTNIDRPDDQWLFLPALKRVKRIASSNKSGQFMGSEFAYEDLLGDEISKFSYTWLRDEACGDWQCHVIERRPEYEDSGYSRQLVWLDRREFRTFKIDYFDHRERLEKTLQFENYRLYLGQYWRAQLMRMSNHLTDGTTILKFAEFEFRTGLGPQDFDPAALRRLR